MQDARALMKSMHLERTMKEVFQSKLEEDIAAGRTTPQTLECIQQIDFSFAEDLYANAFVKTLTPAELKESVAFFNKPAGQWFLDFTMAEAMKARGVTLPAAAEMTPEMFRDFEQFMGTEAAKKLLERREHETPELKNELGAKLAPHILGCMSRQR